MKASTGGEQLNPFKVNDDGDVLLFLSLSVNSTSSYNTSVTKDKNKKKNTTYRFRLQVCMVGENHFSCEVSSYLVQISEIQSL